MNSTNVPVVYFILQMEKCINPYGEMSIFSLLKDTFG